MVDEDTAGILHLCSSLVVLLQAKGSRRYERERDLWQREIWSGHVESEAMRCQREMVV